MSTVRNYVHRVVPWSANDDPVPYNCAYCGNNLVSNVGWHQHNGRDDAYRRTVYIRVCHFCSSPTLIFDNSVQIPEALPGDDVKHLPADVELIYNEARQCVSAGAYTASCLMSRKMLMGIAVEAGANEGLRFVQYINYLEQNGHITPSAREWVDHIKDMGNEATHAVKPSTKQDALDLIEFVSMLLKTSFEYPASIKIRRAKTGGA